MSTKATIAGGGGDCWSLYEEMADDTTWLRTSNHDFVAAPGGVRVLLPPAAIDAIRAVTPDAFPHLRRKAVGGEPLRPQAGHLGGVPGGWGPDAP